MKKSIVLSLIASALVAAIMTGCATWARPTSGEVAGWDVITTLRYANDQWVAVGVGRDIPLILTSPDGTAWTRQTNIDAKGGRLYQLHYANGQWVAAGNSFESGGNFPHSLILTSPDGTVWTRPASGKIGGAGINDLRYENDQWVAVGIVDGTPLILTSPDGTTWTR